MHNTHTLSKAYWKGNFLFAYLSDVFDFHMLQEAKYCPFSIAVQDSPIITPIFIIDKLPFCLLIGSELEKTSEIGLVFSLLLLFEIY